VRSDLLIPVFQLTLFCKACFVKLAPRWACLIFLRVRGASGVAVPACCRALGTGPSPPCSRRSRIRITPDHCALPPLHERDARAHIKTNGLGPTPA
jgi:hypothetical protein